MNTSSQMAIETCQKCLGTAGCADQVVGECLPVPWFGDISNKSIEVATIGLNPSLREFYVNNNPLPQFLRLPLLVDYGKAARGSLSATDLADAKMRRDSYFVDPNRNWHPFFEKLEWIINRANPLWSYALGSAIHFDLVACPTRLTWSKLAQSTKSALIGNCRQYFLQTLAQLPPGTALILDGKKVFDEMKKMGLRMEMITPEPRYMRTEMVGRGRLFHGRREYPVRAWTSYMNYMTTYERTLLGYRLKTSFSGL